MDGKRIDVGDLELQCWDTGTGEPILLVHAGVFGDWFAPVPAELTGFRVIRPHRAGYGGSQTPAGHTTLAGHARHCAGLLRALGIERAHWVGHSSGACVVLQAALDEPDLVHTLTLLETAKPNVPGEARKNIGAAMRAAAAGDVPAAFDLFLGEVCGPGYRETIENRLGEAGLDQALRDAVYFFADELSAVGEWGFDADAARSVRQPALLAEGSESNRRGAGYAERNTMLAGLLPDAEHHVVEGVTHALPLEDPRAVAHLIADFARRHPIT